MKGARLGFDSRRRPSPKPQKPLPPFDPDDPGGIVHRVCPPDQIIPTRPDRDWFIGDAWGVTLPEAPPYVDGANTTPPEMVMSYLLPKYVKFGSKWVDAILTGHAQRSYPHFHLDRPQADVAGLSDKQFVDLIEYVQSWGFFTSFWCCGSGDDRSRGWTSIGPRISSFLNELLSRPQRVADASVCLPGEELNNGCPPGPDGCDSIIRNVCGLCNPVGIPVWPHLTSNYPGYPTNPPPGVNFDQWMVEWIAQWRGMVKGLAWQGDPNELHYPAGAGLMGAKLWDARRYWARALGMDGRVSAFEHLGEAQLYGRCDEEYGNLRGLELIYCTSDGSAPPVTGTMGGVRYPDGSPLNANP